ncbi:hypothetical protein [Streptomyces longisporoflavus]|uniref:IraD/Gp25-like domain-containing protein n=1 Tax=Streptomyces longisporoflavus TaxID=28044 RepID=A0ABW7QFY1_9ACTN
MSAAAEHPFRLTSGRRLAVTDETGHLADLVRLVVLTGATERLHRPGFGPGLGATALFDPLPQLLDGLLEMRTKGALERELAGRVLVDRITVTRLGESTLEVTVDYRPQSPPGPAVAVTARLEA